MKVDISVHAEKVTVEPVKFLGGTKMNLDAEGIDLKSLIQDIGVDAILDEIGKTNCIDHFDIEEATKE